MKYKTVKNYKELCELLGQEPVQGNNRKSQLEDLKRYADFEKIKGKQGYKIKEIYDYPKPKVTKFTKDYIPLLEDNLLTYLLSTNSNEVTLSNSALIKKLNIVNENYFPLKIRKAKLSIYTGLDIKLIEEFYNTTTELNERNILNVLKSLKCRGLIDYKPKKIKEVINSRKVYTIGLNGEIKEDIENYTVYSELTDEEFKYIYVIKEEIRKEMGMLPGIYMNNMELNNFTKRVNERVLEELHINKFYDGYYIVFNRENIINFYNKIGINTEGMILYDMIQKDILSIAQGKPKTKDFRKDYRYIDNYSTLCDMTIKKGADNIIESVIKIRGKQDNYLQ